MAIGEFGGAPADAGRRWHSAGGADVLVLRDEPRGAQSVARLGRRHAVVLQEPGQSAVLHHLRQSRSPPPANCSSARRAATAGRNGASPRRWSAASACRCTSRPSGSGRSAGSSISSASSSTVRSRPQPRLLIVAPMSGHYADAAARHRRGVSAQPRRLHHRLGGRAHGAAVGRTLRSRRLHRLRDLDPARARRRHPRDRGVPAVGAGHWRRSRSWRRTTIPTCRSPWC